MAELTVQAISPSSIDPLANLTAADAAGNTVKVAGNLIFVVDNQDAGARTVTISAPVSSTNCSPYGQVTISDIVVAVPAGEAKYFTLPSGFASDGVFELAYDAVTSTSVGVFVASPNA